MKISVLFPTKNQSAKLLANLKEVVIPYFDATGLTYEVLIDASGSNEANLALLQKGIKGFPLQVSQIEPTSHLGKGYAVGRLLKAAKGDYSLFMDADLSTDLKAFDEIIPLLGSYDAFFGSRHSKDSIITKKQTALRRLTSVGSRFIIRAMFHLGAIKDTQCGFKAFRNEVGKNIAAHQIIDGFAFDVEYAYILKLNGCSIKEIPVTWENDPDSSVSAIKTSINFMKDLLKIKKNKKNYFFKGENHAD